MTITRLSKFSLCVLFGVLTASRSFASDDVIYLRDGGQVRGELIELDPLKGAVLRLPDHTQRTIAPADITYAGKINTGAIQVDAAAPGDVVLDRDVVGRVPLRIENVWPGRHRIAIRYDSGEESERVILVSTGKVELVHMPPAELEVMGAAHTGWHGLLGGGALAAAVVEDGHLGVSAHGGASLGLTPRLELRFTGTLGLVWVGSEGISVVGAVQAAARVGLSALYAMEAGLRVGAVSTGAWEYRPNEGYVTWVEHYPAFGLELSFVTLRFGDLRQYELGLWHALSYVAGAGGAAFENGISFTYVIL